MMLKILAKSEFMWGRLKSETFQQITGYNLKTVPDKYTVSVRVKQEFVRALLSGYVADDLG